MDKTETHTHSLPKEPLRSSELGDAVLLRTFDQSPIGAAIVSTDHRFLRANSELCRILGYTEEELTQRRFTDITHPDHLSADTQEVTRLLKEEIDHYTTDKRYLRKDGGTVWGHTSVRLLKDQQGVPRYLLPMIEDITQRKKAEEHTQLTLQVLELLNSPRDWMMKIPEILFHVKSHIDFEAVGIRLKEGEDFPYFVVNGFSAHFVEAERSLCAQLPNGQILREENGKPALECLCGNILLGRTDHSLPFFTERGSFWTNSTTQLLASVTQEQLQNPCGLRGRCHREGYESLALIPLRSGDEIVGLLHLCDRREGRLNEEVVHFLEKLGDSIGVALAQRNAELRLRDSEMRYRALVETTDTGFVIIDKNGIVLDANQEYVRLTGRGSLDDIRGRSVVEWTAECEKEKNEAGVARCFAEGHIRNFEVDYVSADGKITAIEVNATVVDLEGAPRIFTLCRDITERRRNEERLTATNLRLEEARARAEAANKAKSEFLANTSHELRTPLNAVLGFLDLIHTENLDQKQKQYLDIASKRAADLLAIINDLLDLARIESEQLDLDESDIEIAKILHDALVNIEIAAKDKGLTVASHIDTAIPKLLRGDGLRIKQVLINLLGNAVKFTYAGRINVDVSLLTGGGGGNGVHHIRFTVADTGIGILSDKLEKIFESFYQIDSASTRKFEGTGLGLAICKRLVAKMHGSIWVESEPGKGSAFTFVIPLKPQREPNPDAR